jgi:hypothetical protein
MGSTRIVQIKLFIFVPWQQLLTGNYECIITRWGAVKEH